MFGRKRVSEKQEKRYGEIQTELTMLHKETQSPEVQKDVPLLLDKYERMIQLIEEKNRIKKLNPYNKAQLKMVKMTFNALKKSKRLMKG